MNYAPRNCRPEERRGYVAHGQAYHPGYPMSTGQSLKSPAQRQYSKSNDEDLPLTGKEAVFAIAIVCISFIAVCLVVKFFVS